SFTYGSGFDLTSLEIWPLGDYGLDCSPDGLPCPPYDNVVLIGYRGNARIARTAFPMGSGASLFSGAGLFSHLTSLEIYAPPPGPDTQCCDIHFDVDNVVLA